jgi:cellulose synthase/poly-beta-1,6-N-acetylglucosamine synthase-like glycosyltransferase
MRELTIGSVLLAAILLIPVLVVCIECLAALLPRRLDQSKSKSASPRPGAVVVVPAHNEELVLAGTLTQLQALLLAGDRLIVVADNCTDRTVEIARGFSAEVIERHDLTQVGKGYALDFAARYLDADARMLAEHVVIVIDADCGVSFDALNALAQQVASTNGPAQAIYTMARPLPPATPGELVSSLAFLLRNQVRPRGLKRLGMPCALTGSGMAFPWPVFRDAPLGTSCIVEDLQLGIDLLIKNHPTRLCEGARILGTLPEDHADAIIQRTRWEHGHLWVACSQVPRLLKSAISELRLAPLVMALDVLVPPLSLLIMTLFAATLMAIVWAMIGQSHWPVRLLLTGDLAMGACLIASWISFGRSILPLVSFAAIPRYVASKLPLYLKFIIRRQTRWIRTSRDNTRPPEPPATGGGSIERPEQRRQKSADGDDGMPGRKFAWIH